MDIFLPFLFLDVNERAETFVARDLVCWEPKSLFEAKTIFGIMVAKDLVVILTTPGDDNAVKRSTFLPRAYQL
jgi:hypothetical protein